MINTNDTIWLTTSLFAARNNWPLLVKEGIKPVLNKLNQQKKINDVEISINDFLGDNIRLALFINKDFAAEVSEELHNHFTLLLATLQPPVIDEEDFPKTLFCPFYNTIRYGLYNTPVYNDLKPVQKEIELIIMDVLPISGFTDENLLMVSLYLHLGLARVLLQYERENEHILQYYNYGYNNKTEAFLQPLLEENKEQLEEIATDILGDNFVINPEAAWVLNWITTCEKLIRHYREADPHCSLQSIHAGITAEIDIQLNISLHVKPVLVYFLIHIFNRFKV